MDGSRLQKSPIDVIEKNPLSIPLGEGEMKVTILSPYTIYH